VDRIRDPAAVVAELREIEDTRGRLDRHARGTSAPPSEITSRARVDQHSKRRANGCRPRGAGRRDRTRDAVLRMVSPRRLGRGCAYATRHPRTIPAARRDAFRRPAAAERMECARLQCDNHSIE
jgi:hypothetical protein